MRAIDPKPQKFIDKDNPDQELTERPYTEEDGFDMMDEEDSSDDGSLDIGNDE